MAMEVYTRFIDSWGDDSAGLVEEFKTLNPKP